MRQTSEEEAVAARGYRARILALALALKAALVGLGRGTLELQPQRARRALSLKEETTPEKRVLRLNVPT